MIPPGYTVRSATWDDLSDVTRVAVACDLLDWGSAVIEEQDIRNDWNRPAFRLERDTVVVVSEDGELVAYAGVMEENEHREVEVWGAVDPGHRGLGIGALLLDRMEACAAVHAGLAADGSTKFRPVVAATDAAANDVALWRGCELIRIWWHMEMELPSPFDAGHEPEGIRLERFVRNRDEPEIHRVLGEAFSEHWGSTPTSFDEWTKQHMERPGFHPDLWFVAWEGDTVVGVSLGTIRLDMGWIWEVGVLKPWRGRGIAAALLRRALAQMAERGLPRVGLNVDAQNETGATALYEKIGMREVKRFNIYEKELRAEDSTTG